MIDIGLTETVKSDPLKFGLWLQNKSEFFTLQVLTIQTLIDLWFLFKLYESRFKSSVWVVLQKILDDSLL